MTTQLLLRPAEAAKSLGISERQLWEHTAPRGPIPAVRIGANVRYSPSQLADWIAAQLAEATEADRDGADPHNET